MATTNLVPTSIVSQSGFTGANVTNLSAIGGSAATGGVAGSSILAEITDAPVDFSSQNSVTLQFRANTVGSVSRTKTLTLTLEDAAGTVLQTYAVNLTGTATTYTSSAFSRADGAAAINAYRLRAVITEGGGMADSATVSVDFIGVVPLNYNIAVLPGTIANLAVSGTPTWNQVNLTWSDVANETEYRVHRSTTDGFTPSGATAGSGTCISVKAAGSTSHTDTPGNQSGATITYYYKVVAANASGTTTSNQVTASVPTLPLAPTGLAFNPYAGKNLLWNKARLTWTDNATTETGYRVHRNPGAGDFTPSGITAGSGTCVAVLGANSTSYENTGLSPNTAYSWKIEVYSAQGSSFSSHISGTTMLTPVDADTLTEDFEGGYDSTLFEEVADIGNQAEIRFEVVSGVLEGAQVGSHVNNVYRALVAIPPIALRDAAISLEVLSLMTPGAEIYFGIEGYEPSGTAGQQEGLYYTLTTQDVAGGELKPWGVYNGTHTYHTANKVTWGANKGIRVRHSTATGLLYWEYTADFDTWSVARSEALSGAGAFLDGAKFFLSIGIFDPTSGITKLDNINLVPSSSNPPGSFTLSPVTQEGVAARLTWSASSDATSYVIRRREV